MMGRGKEASSSRQYTRRQAQSSDILGEQSHPPHGEPAFVREDNSLPGRALVRGPITRLRTPRSVQSRCIFHEGAESRGWAVSTVSRFSDVFLPFDSLS